MKVLIAGDFCPSNRVTNAFEKLDYSSVLEEVRIITEAKYSIVNFECAIVEKEIKPIKKLGPNLQCNRKGLEAVKYAGFNCVTLANNHFLDFGKEGVENTIATLDALNIDHVGGGLNMSEASRILYKVIEGQRLAIINCCEHEFSIATESSAGSNPLNPIQQYYAIKEAKSKADYVLVIVHGGHEHFQLPSLRMVETYRFFIDAGADVVVNHHQHCYSGYETYKGKLIFYGLGNFCFDNPCFHSGIWTEGYAITIFFSAAGLDFELHPYCQCTETPKVVLLPKNAFADKLKELNGIITDLTTLQSYIDSYYSSCASQYSNIFEPIQNRYYFGAKKRGWLPSLISKKHKLRAADFVCCEAHRDKVLWWLEH